MHYLSFYPMVVKIYRKNWTFDDLPKIRVLDSIGLSDMENKIYPDENKKNKKIRSLSFYPMVVKLY